MEPMSESGELHKNLKRNQAGVWLALGVGIGTAVGVALNNIAVGVGIGIALGMGVGAMIDRRRKKDKRG